MSVRVYKCGITSTDFASKSDFDYFQEGFRDDGITKDCHVSTEKGYWQPSWYVIARDSMMGDPYFINTDDNKIYFVGHDGDWAEGVTNIVDDIDSFIKIMGIIDNNLGEVYEDDYDLEERINMIDNTLNEMKRIDQSVNEDYFKSMFEVWLGIY